MSKLSPEQIAQAAHDAGFRGDDLTTAVAIALAESSGDPRAHNPVPPDDSYGLWQINMIGALGPDRRDQFDLDADKELFDPETNAKAAFAISGDGNSFQPWTTFTSGAYEEHLDEARKGVRAMRSDDRGDGNDRGDGKGDKGDKGDSRGGDRGRNGGGGDGFRVDPDALAGYAKSARTIADELAALRAKELHKVRSVADDSFGRIGKETGFADALNSFGQSLQRQVRGAGRKADTLAASVTKTARHYREQDADIADELLALLQGK
ncbi:transglycosylase SLT domain-containing protein [Actinophytocola sp.]|uniref:transglycosylase SLT domain-containing protein n=1 Tax=Actinophytocola sp. TaxID=1872138 RepID=UPI003D6A3228